MHGRQRRHCRPCGGSAFCEHGKTQNRCKGCSGASICKHQRERSACKECDHAGYIRRLITGRVNTALKTDKDRGSLEYLGCSIEEFKRHIESTFQPGMSWDNHGAYRLDGPRVWHIDHNIPIMFEKDTLSKGDVCARLHWTNTQAMWAEENIAKGNRFVGRAHQPVTKTNWLSDEEFSELMSEYV